ncbi:MAG TPA: type II secretion system F family protein [Phycisphaerae bacterium]|nr:type II secretion system F family protein [Phycisphaerae bacterium]HNU43922.1 type II secretion system F family protein [Phycisphaerae bacterium]
MAQFEYRAQLEGGAAVAGTLEAGDATEALAHLEGMGLTTIEVAPTAKPVPVRALSGGDLIFFNEQLAALARAGLCLDAGLRQLAKDVGSSRLGTVLEQTANEVEKGRPLEEALEGQATRLPPLYGRVIRAGIRNGQLAETLLNLSQHLRLMADTRRLVAEALAYPVAVLAVAGALFCTIMLVLVPQVRELLAGFDLSWGTARSGVGWLANLVMTLSEWMPVLVPVGAVVFVLAVVLWMAAGTTAPGRAVRERLVLGLPIIGALVADSLRARFIQAMAFAVRAGLPLPEGLRLAGEAGASPGVAEEAARVAAQVEQGTAAFEACRRTRLIPPMFGYVVQVSAQRGNPDEALTQLAQTYAERASRRQALVRHWLMPVALVLVGVMIGACIVAVYAPLLQMLNVIQSVS